MAAETVLPATSMVKVHLYLKLAELTYRVCLSTPQKTQHTMHTAAFAVEGCVSSLLHACSGPSLLSPGQYLFSCLTRSGRASHLGLCYHCCWCCCCCCYLSLQAMQLEKQCRRGPSVPPEKILEPLFCALWNCVACLGREATLSVAVGLRLRRFAALLGVSTPPLTHVPVVRTDEVFLALYRGATNSSAASPEVTAFFLPVPCRVAAVACSWSSRSLSPKTAYADAARFHCARFHCPRL